VGLPGSPVGWVGLAGSPVGWVGIDGFPIGYLGSLGSSELGGGVNKFIAIKLKANPKNYCGRFHNNRSLRMSS